MTEVYRGKFYADVRVEVRMPLEWTTLIKAAGDHHYDARCRAFSQCGALNGLHNCALWLVEDPTAEATMYPLSWHDLDTLTKICEQLHWHAKPEQSSAVGAIGRFLRETKDAISAADDRANAVFK